MPYYINKYSCTACGYCADVCMNGAIAKLTDEFIINPSWCNDCGSCEVMCYEKAIFYDGLDVEHTPHYALLEDAVLYLQEHEMEEYLLI